MNDKSIILFALYYMYYHIGGLATTNILRLTTGNTLPVLSSTCVCDNCNEKISVLDQFPIFSYIACKGKCRNCGTKIPVFPLILEIVVATGMSLITTAFHVSYIGVMASFLYYEVIRIVVIMIKGRRKNQFAKEYAIATLIMITYWIPTLWAVFLYQIV